LATGPGREGARRVETFRILRPLGGFDAQAVPALAQDLDGGATEA
jgi:hypothetical protein